MPRQLISWRAGAGISPKVGTRDRKPAAEDIPAGPGRVLRSEVQREIYGYLLTHYAISALICKAATEAGIDPDRVKFKRTVRILRRRVADPAFPPEQQQRAAARVMATSPGRRTSTRSAATGPIPGWSSEPATTPTA